MFGANPPPKCAFVTDPEVGEWDYGKYEGMLTKDIKKEKPNWSIWDDGWVAFTPRRYKPLISGAHRERHPESRLSR